MGGLLSAGWDIGGLVGGLEAEQRAALRAYGRSLGLAFQIADDVLDYTSTAGEVGKPIGHDILEGFATLPLMLSSIKIDDDRRLDEREARSVVDAVRRSTGPKLALESARQHANAALDHLRSLPPGEARDALAALTDYAVTRRR